MRYCLSAHAALGRATADRPSNDREPLGFERLESWAALRFAQSVVQRGAVSNQELAEVRGRASPSDIAEIIGNVALNVFTNYFNRAAETAIDFPRVTAGQLT